MNKLYQRIDQILMENCNDQSVLDVSELHGFLTAVCSAPQPIAIELWMAQIWGGEELIPEWTSEQQIHEFVDCIMRFYSQVMESLFADSFTPIYSDVQSIEKASTKADEWCFGYLRGIKLWNTLQANDSAFLDNSLQAMRMFATDEGIEQLETLSQEEIQFWLVEIERSARNIYRHFASHAMLAKSNITKSNHVGRNEPCPCGSGKKYKKCCISSV